jgi:hypothetical protein
MTVDKMTVDKMTVDKMTAVIKQVVSNRSSFLLKIQMHNTQT